MNQENKPNLNEEIQVINEETNKTEEVSNYYTEINKHIAEIERLCRINLVPMLITYVNPVTEEYVSDVITPRSIGIELKTDKISKLNIALNNNFSIKINSNDPRSFSEDLFNSIVEEM